MTMNLFGKNPHSQEIEFDNDLVIAQAEYLKTNLYIANIGTTSVVLFLTYLFWTPGLAPYLMTWVCLSLSATVFRSILMSVYRQSNCFQDKPKVAKNISSYIPLPQSYLG